MDPSLRIRFFTMGGLFVALAVLGLVLSSFYRGTATTKTVVVPFDIDACEEDDDCGVTNQIGCCPCEVGGGQGAVNKKMRSRLRAFLRTACRDTVACVTVPVCRDDLQATCASGRCTLVASVTPAASGARVPDEGD